MVEEQTIDARKQLAMAEETVLHALAEARAVVTAQEDELRQARLERAQRDDDLLTEKQYAEILQVSKVTMAKLRKDGKLKPLYVASMPRYTRSHHVAHVAWIFGEKKGKCPCHES